MPMTRGAIQLARYEVRSSQTLRPRSLVQRLRPFHSLEAGEERTSGWVSIFDTDVSAQEAGQENLWWQGDLLLGYRIDEAKVPAAQLRKSVEAWRRAFSDREGRKPSKGELSDQKELILKGLRKQAFVQSKVCELRWRVEASELQIWATSPRLLDEVLVAVEEDLRLELGLLGPGGRTETIDLEPTDVLFQGGAA